MRVAPQGTTVLTSRNGIDFTDEFADLATVSVPALDGQAERSGMHPTVTREQPAGSVMAPAAPTSYLTIWTIRL